MVSEQPERFFVSEIIREQIFVQYEKEIPYSCQVQIVDFKERRNAKDYIQVSQCEGVWRWGVRGGGGWGEGGEIVDFKEGYGAKDCLQVSVRGVGVARWGVTGWGCVCVRGGGG